MTLQWRRCACSHIIIIFDSACVVWTILYLSLEGCCSALCTTPWTAWVFTPEPHSQIFPLATSLCVSCVKRFYGALRRVLLRVYRSVRTAGPVWGRDRLSPTQAPRKHEGTQTGISTECCNVTSSRGLYNLARLRVSAEYMLECERAC